MTIFFAGHEPSAGIIAESFTTNTSWFRSAYSRSAAYSRNGYSPLGAELSQPAVSTTDEFWFHFYKNIEGSHDGFLGPCLVLYGAEAQPLVMLRGSGSGSDKKVTLRVYNPTTAAEAEVTESAVTYAATDGLVDLKLAYAASQLTATLYLDGVQHLTVSVAAASSADLLDIHGFYVSSPMRVRFTYFSEFLLADVSTISAEVKTIPLTGVDVSSGWSGSHADLSDVEPDGAAMVTDTNEDIARLTIDAAAGNPDALFFCANGAGANGGALVPGVRVSGVDYFGDPADFPVGINRGQALRLLPADVGGALDLSQIQQVLLKYATAA